MSWFFIAALLTWSLAAGYFPSLVSESDPAQLLLAALIAMLGLFGSLILHELAHAVVAQREGVPVCTITLFLFGGVAEMRNEPPNAAAELRIALVGPLASLVLSVLAFGLAAAARGMGAPDLGVAVLRYLALANLVLAVFNMLPAFPLDGGRVFRAMLWRRSRDLSAATRRAAQVSAAIAYGMMALGVVQILTGGGALGLWPVLLGLFILVAGRSAQSRIEMRDALAGRSVAEVMRREVVAVDPGMTLQSLVDEVILT
ncbi:MAG: site-2 protease family protein, partial [Pseudomonadota bacterium]